MNRLIIILVIFLLILGGVVFFQLSQAAVSVKVNGKVTIGKNIFNVETVKTDTDKQIGLTKYKDLRDNQGMLFPFDSAGFPSFWMKNMKFPIDIIFINNDTIVSIAENASVPAANTQPAIYKPDAPANYVLEIKAGLVKKDNIKKGDKVTINI